MTDYAIQTIDNLTYWFYKTSRQFDSKKRLMAGVYISSKIRKDFLCSFYQGKIIINGKVIKIDFDNCGSGVYKAYIHESKLR